MTVELAQIADHGDRLSCIVSPTRPNEGSFDALTKVLSPHLRSPQAIYAIQDGIVIACLPNYSSSMLANAYFFSQRQCLQHYVETENCIPEFEQRWRAALDKFGKLKDKVVVEIGCGPGNLNRMLKIEAKALIGIDISWDALKQAYANGYIPLLADAQDIPLVSDCADVVLVNAALHHCDDMERVLTEAARLVRSGGYLVTDMDPQNGACKYQGLGWFLYHLRFLRMFYRKLTGSPDYISPAHQFWRLATETHKQHPGDGVAPQLYEDVLGELGFTYNLYSHNHYVGAELFKGERGKAPWAVRLGQRLSGIDPNSDEAALSMMCVAQKY